MSSATWAKNNFPNIELIDVGEGLHYAPETNAQIMGESISIWMQGIEQASV